MTNGYRVTVTIMVPCSLKNPVARSVVEKVWKHLRSHFPGDCRILTLIVKRIDALTDEETEDGTMGQWCAIHFRDFEEERQWLEKVGAEHGQCDGVIFLLDSEKIDRGTLAHELGHAFSSLEDLSDRKSPIEEWASEAAADMHAVRWGLLTNEDIRQRYNRNVSKGSGTNTAWGHHGPPPGGCLFEAYGIRYRLNEDFVFEPAEE
jgi:hypothetical protein